MGDSKSNTELPEQDIENPTDDVRLSFETMLSNNVPNGHTVEVQATPIPGRRSPKQMTPAQSQTQIAQVEYEVRPDPNNPGKKIRQRHVKYFELPDTPGQKTLLQSLSVKGTMRQLKSRKSLRNIAFGCLPCLNWICTYDTKTMLKDDIIAGATVGIMIIPQSMAYALIAGLPTLYGLYSSVMPIYLYSIFGSSRQLAVGPVALVSLLVEASLSGMGLDSTEDQAKWIQYAGTLALLAGLFQIFLGTFRLGFVVNFLSHSVVSGFTSGAAITIGLSQMKHMLGYSIKKSHHVNETLESMFSNIHKIHWGTFVMGMVWLGILLTFKTAGKEYPSLKMMRALGPLLVVVVSTATMAITRWNEQGIKVVGEIEPGFPDMFTDFAWDDIGTLLSSSVVIAFVGFMESVAISKSLAAKNKYEIHANQELVGLGIANAVGAVFSAYPITGSFSRSAVNNDTGAKSGLAAIITATMVVVVLLAFTEALYFLPQNALAAIVLSAVSGLFDYQEFKFLWKVSKRDCLLWTVSLFGTLFLGIELGIGIAVASSLAFVIYESARPHTAELGQLPGTSVYRNVEQYPDAVTVDGIVILRIDAPIYFANVDYIKDKLRHYEHMAIDRSASLATSLSRLDKGVQYVILEMSPITFIDATGLHALKTIVEEYKQRGIHLALANPHRRVLEQLQKVDFLSLVGREYLFLRVQDAVAACMATMEDELSNAGVNNFHVPDDDQMQLAK